MIKRLLSELRAMQLRPDPNFIAGPVGDDLVVWHFSIRGPPDTPFEGGIYHGKIVFPADYPYKPPDVFFLTPNGRFEVNRAICLNTTSYHPESWQPLWGVSSLLTALVAFLPTKAEGVGSMTTSDEARRELAQKSRCWKCPECSIRFPDQVCEDTAEAEPQAEPEPEPAPEPAAAPEPEVKEEAPAVEKATPYVPPQRRKNPAKFVPLLDVPIILIFLALLLLVIDTQFPLGPFFKRFPIRRHPSPDRENL
jgi:ubiquitin-conjugating enzyme E2 J1